MDASSNALKDNDTMKPGQWHELDLNTEQMGYVAMAVRQILRKDLKGAKRFGTDLDPDSSLAHRIRVGQDVAETFGEALDRAEEDSHEDERESRQDEYREQDSEDEDESEGSEIRGERRPPGELSEVRGGDSDAASHADWIKGVEVSRQRLNRHRRDDYERS